MKGNPAVGQPVRPRAAGRPLAVRLPAILLAVCLPLAGCTTRHASRATPAPSTGAPAQAPGAGPTSPAGSAPLGVKWDWSRVEQFTPFLRQLSGGATFYELVWCDVEPNRGQRDWSQVDAVAQTTRQLGYALLLKLRVGSCWATGGTRGRVRGVRRTTASAMPLRLDDYRAFVRAAVQRYAAMGVHTWSVENEIDAQQFFWDGTPEQYEQLATVGAAAIRSADPGASVFDSGLASPVYGVAIAARLLGEGRGGEAVATYQRYYAQRHQAGGAAFPPVADVTGLRSVLADTAARRALDCLAVTQRLARQHVIDGYQLHFYEPWDNVPALVAYLHDALPPSFPIQAWEVGAFWPGGPADPESLAAAVTKTVTGLLAGGVRRVIWLPLAYNPARRQDGELRFGLLDPNGGVRPSGAAFLRLAAAARGAAWRAVSGGGISGIAFGRDSASTLVLWSDAGATLPPPRTPGSKATGLTGEPLPLGPAGLRLGQQPILVTVPARLAEAVRMVP